MREDRTWDRAGEVGRDLHLEECVDETRVAVLEEPALRFFAGMCDDQADAEQRLDEEAADIGRALPERFDLRGEFALIASHGPNAKRQQDHRDDEKADVEIQHQRGAANQEDDVREDGEQCVAGDALDLRDVVVHTRNNFTGARAGKERRGQGQQVAVQREAHVEQDLRGDFRVEVAGHRVEDEAGQRDEDEKSGDAGKRVKVASEESLVDEVASQPGLREAGQGRKKADEDDARQGLPVRREVRQDFLVLSQQGVLYRPCSST
jgi:hypothetical protein